MKKHEREDCAQGMAVHDRDGCDGKVDYVTGEPLPEPAPGPSDSEKLAHIQGIFASFNWELDDRQYVLEAIERIVNS